MFNVLCSFFKKYIFLKIFSLFLVKYVLLSFVYYYYDYFVSLYIMLIILIFYKYSVHYLIIYPSQKQKQNETNKKLRKQYLKLTSNFFHINFKIFKNEIKKNSFSQGKIFKKV